MLAVTFAFDLNRLASTIVRLKFRFGLGDSPLQLHFPYNKTMFLP